VSKVIYCVKHFWAGDDEPAEYFIESDKTPTPTEALKILNDNGKQIQFEPDQGEVIVVSSLDVKKAIVKLPKYNHAFTIAFSVESDNDCENVTAKELKEGLSTKVKELFSSDDMEILEACGLPYDTYEND
jgi:hypothetical protein